MFEKDIRKLRRRIKNFDFEENTIAFYGSSSIRLWVNIERDLHPFSILNLGFGGSTFYWMNEYFHDIFDEIEVSHVVLYGGDNDMSNDFSPSDIREQFVKLKRKLETKYPGVIIHGITIKPSPHRKEYLEAIKLTNEYLRKELTRDNKIYQADVFHDMLDNKNQPRAELFLSDGLHMNKKGYEVWTKSLQDYLKKMGPKPHSV